MKNLQNCRKSVLVELADRDHLGEHFLCRAVTDVKEELDSTRESGNGRGRPCSLPRRIRALPWPSTVPSGGEMLAEMIT